MYDVATNLRRLMARWGLTLEQVVEMSGLHERTIKGILTGTKPHARTLHLLATGLGVASDELFQDPSLLAHRLFDRHTNPVVDQIVASYPQWFEGWNERDFDELYSCFGTGGGLTEEGTIATVQAMNNKRRIYHRVALLLESGEADLLSAIVDVLYQRIEVR